uniref:EGF-like domain-containing protein n=1 Tax=Rhabditophanes sp. KR3021 TaxID=114890 RepID=A0AC35TKT9_9BILA
MDTVIFKAQLLFQNKMTRKDIIDKVHVDSNDRLTIVKLKPLHITSKVVQNIQSTFRFPNVYNEDSYCYNGVITLNNTCVCPDYFEGSTCFTPTCLNGGYPLEYTKCVCPPGFAGEHCQALPCGASSSIGDFDFSKKSFIVIVNTRESMTVDTEYAFPAIASSVGDFVLNNPDYYTNFILIAYLKNKNMNYMATFERNDFHEFIEDLQDVIISNGDEQQPTLSAIIKGLTSIRILRPKSPVYLFTDATISDSLATLDPNYYYDSQSQILRLLLGWNLNLQIATTTSPIHPSFTTKTLDYQVLQGLAQASGGDIFNFGANKNLIGQFVASYMTVLVNVEAAEYSYNFNVDPQGSPYPLSYYDSNADASFVLIVSGEVEIQEMVPTTSIGNILSIYIIPKDTEKFDTTKRTLSIVMSATSSQAYIKMQLYNGTNAFINNNVDIMSTMYDQFVMTRYGIVTKLTGETENVLDQIIYDDYQTFMYQMELLNFEYTTSTTQNTLSGIYDALSGKIAYNKKQTLIVFVDYAASELATNPDLLDQIKLQAIQNQVPINIFITPQFSGNSRQCIATQDMVPFQTLAKVTGGFFINQCQTYHDQTIANFMQQFLNVGASLESVAISDNSDCSAFTDITATFSQDLGNKYVLINYAAEVVPSKLIVTLDGVPRAFSSISTIPFIAIYDVSALLANKAYTIKFSQAETVYCRLIAGEDSTINHFLRFSDSPDSDYNSFNPIRGTFQHPVLHVSGSKSPFASAMLSVDDPGTGNQVNLQTTLNRISPCNFKGYFADSYSCTTAEDVPIFFNSVVSHADGSITRRALPTYCNTLQDYNCLNGGTFLNGKCMCDTNFSGNNCEIITCMNNGNADEGSCACSSSFGGQFCEYAICKAFNTNYMINNDANLEYQSIAYFIETSADAKDMNVLLAAHADSLDSFSHQLRNKFSLITFDDLSVTMQLDTVNSKVFYSEMQGVISTTTSAKTGVYTKSFEALNTFLSKNIEVPTLAYVFTTSEVADYSTHYADIIQHAQSKNVQINFIFYSDDSLIWNKASKPMMAMNSIALTTSGRFLVLNGKTLPTFIGDYMDDTIFENAILYNEYDDQSLTQLSRSSNIPLQNSTFGVTIIVKGEDVNKDFGVFDQDGNKIEHLNNTVIWSKDLIVIYLPFYEGNYGALTVKATTSSIPYHIQVRTYDSYNIRVGFVQNYNDDMAAPFPMLNQGNKYFVALHDQHSEYRRSLGSIDAVKIYAVTPQKSFSSQAVEYKFIQRNTIGCAFEYVSNKITFPTDPSELMAVKIVGQDQYQNRFQRLYFYFPITPTCANNNMYDSVKGKCLCDTNHQGSVCSYPICHNGGTSDFGICNCQVGFYGDYCESYLN